MPRAAKYGDDMSNNNVVDLTTAVRAFNAQAYARTVRAFQRIGAMLGQSHEGKRDIYEVYGYPAELGGEVGFQRMYQYATRQGIANRITFGMARSCWRDGFELRSDPEDEESVQLEDPMRELFARGLVQKLERADVLNRIGRFSVLLVGVPDGRELSQPVGTARGRLDQVYFQPYAYDSAEPLRFDDNPRSPRFGMPETYTLHRTPRRDNEKDRSRLNSITVHHSRLVLLSENLLDSDVEGIGALEPVFNRILDLDKATGGSAEAYFRNARRLIGYEVDKEYASELLNDPEQKAAFDEGAKRFTNEWQDHITAAGAKIHTLDAAHHSPLDTVKTALWEVSGYTGIPLRVLTGEGAGQLAGSEDQLAYNHLVGDRQRVFCRPTVEGVLQILSAAGMVEYDPKWTVVFPPQQASTEGQQADVDDKRASALEKATRALSTPAGDELDTESVLQELGLSGIKTVEPPPLEPPVDAE